MKKIFLTLVLGIFFISLALAFSICVDVDPPSLMNSTLNLTATSGAIQLSWTPATDIPSCSGIDHYDIYRSTDGTVFSFIGSSLTNNYIDSGLSSGSAYYYMIHAFDLVGHNEAEEGLSNSEPISPVSISDSGTDEGGSGSGGGGGIDNFFSCEDWEKCIDGIQTRTCVDVGGSLPDRTESRDCFSEFEPLSSETGGIIENNEKVQSTGFLTGAVTGVTDFVKTGKGIASLIFAIIILGATGLIIYKRRKTNIRSNVQEKWV